MTRIRSNNAPLFPPRSFALVAGSFSPEFLSQATNIVRGFIKSSSKIHSSNPLSEPFLWSNVYRPGSKVSEWMNSKSLLALLRLPFGCLECFSIIVHRDDWDTWSWNNFSSELKDALSNIIHTSSLKTLSLTGITKVPITFFLHIVHLTTLELHSISLYDFYDKNSRPLSVTRAASKRVVPMVSHTVIDRCVWRFTGREHCPVYEIPFICLFLNTNSGQIRSYRSHRFTESIFLPFLCRLRFLEIYVGLGSASGNNFGILSFLMGSLRTSLTSPATLEHLEFNIQFRGSIYDLKNSRTTFYKMLRFADVWRHLDSITTNPTGSQLQRVDIKINYCFRCKDYRNEPDEDKVEKAVLEGLPLLRKKGILFVEATLGTWSR